MELLEKGDKVLVEMTIKESFKDFNGHVVYIMAKNDDVHLRPVPGNMVYLSSTGQICVYSCAVKGDAR